MKTKLNTVEEEATLLKNLVGNTDPKLTWDYIISDVKNRREASCERLKKDLMGRYENAELSDFGYFGEELVKEIESVFNPPDDLTGFKNGILLYGPPGCGKTYALNGLWKWLMGRDPSKCLLFSNYAEFMQRIREEFADGSYRESGSWWNIVTDTEIYKGMVILDDIGTSKFSDFELEKLYIILEKRISDCAPMVISTNLPLEKNEDLLGGRISSRLNFFTQIAFPNVDMRKAE